ncbi:MAG: copper-binding protein [Burkholderiales bacterium]|nr:copper-binding protein [Burkholderiales bacterium]
MKPLWIAAALGSSLFHIPALADQVYARSAPVLLAQASAWNDGEIRKIDKSAGKITIKHGPLAKLDMPPMTMAFQVKDRALLDQVKPGDKVRFEAEKAGAAYVVTKMEPAK